MTLFHVQLAATSIGVAALAFGLWHARAVATHLRAFLFEPSAAFNLGALRLWIFGQLLGVALKSKASLFAALPDGARGLPLGWRWTADWLPLEPTPVQIAERVLVVASALACVGLGTRVVAPLAACLAVYVLGVPNFFFKVDHGSHASVLCALAIAFAPCGDALSLDRLWLRLRGRAAPPLSSAYTVAVRSCWLILGTVYFFPGLWKLRKSGDLWISGLQLQRELHEKWGQLEGFVPPFRIDESITLCALFGTLTLLFELGFIFALFWRPARVVAALSAVAFHLGVLFMMRIRFHAFLPLILLLDFPQLGLWASSLLPAGARERITAAVSAWRQRARLPPAFGPPRSSSRARSPALPLLVGTALVAGQLITGFGQINTWPVSVHPTFSDRQDQPVTRVSKVKVVLRTQAGETRDLSRPLRSIGGARMHIMLDRLNPSSSARTLKRYGGVLRTVLRERGIDVKPGDRIEIDKERWDLLPLNARSGYKSAMLARFEVSDDGSLRPSNRRRRD
jgi:hypothetical protein